MTALGIALDEKQRADITAAALIRGMVHLGFEDLNIPRVIETPNGEDIEWVHPYDVFDWGVSVPIMEYSLNTPGDPEHPEFGWGSGRFVYCFGTRENARRFRDYLRWNGIYAEMAWKH